MSAVNRHGTPANLIAPAEIENTRALRHGVYSPRVLEPIAQEIASRILDAPHTVELDEIGAVEIGRLEALIQAIDGDLAARGLTGKGGDARTLVDLRLRASRRLAEWLDRYGMNPQARAQWAAALGSGGLAAEIARRRAALAPDNDAA